MAHQKPHDPMASVVMVGSILVLLATLYVLVSNLFSTIEQNTTKGADDLSLQMAAADINIKPIGAVHTVDKSIAPKVRTGEEVYGAICTGCHEAGALNAPKTNTKEDWTARIANGWKALMDSAINGKGQMPARGGDPSLTDDEIKNAILYMTSKAGFDLASEASAGEAPAEAANNEADKAEDNTANNTNTASAPTAPASAPTTEDSASAPVAPQAPAQTNTPAAPQAPEVTKATPAPQAPAQTNTPAAPQAPEAASATPAPEAPAPTASPEATPAPAAPAATTAAVPTAANEQGEKIYKSLCFSCHDMGIAGSPKLSDKEAWKARIATGMEALYASSINGKGAMPAKGGNPSLSDEDVKAAVDYMIFNVK